MAVSVTAIPMDTRQGKLSLKEDGYTELGATQNDTIENPVVDAVLHAWRWGHKANDSKVFRATNTSKMKTSKGSTSTVNTSKVNTSKGNTFKGNTSKGNMPKVNTSKGNMPKVNTSKESISKANRTRHIQTAQAAARAAKASSALLNATEDDAVSRRMARRAAKRAMRKRGNGRHAEAKEVRKEEDAGAVEENSTDALVPDGELDEQEPWEEIEELADEYALDAFQEETGGEFPEETSWESSENETDDMLEAVMAKLMGELSNSALHLSRIEAEAGDYSTEAAAM